MQSFDADLYDSDGEGNNDDSQMMNSNEVCWNLFLALIDLNIFKRNSQR